MPFVWGFMALSGLGLFAYSSDKVADATKWGVIGFIAFKLFKWLGK